MDGFALPVFFVAVLLAALMGRLADADHEYMVTKAESITMPLGFETKLECMMNIEPDKFQWKFYPLKGRDVYNPRAAINLSKDQFTLLPQYKHSSVKRQSDLTIKVKSGEIAGDYQCLAYYGASVFASVPWRITIATLGQFPPQNNVDVTVVQGNTINWRCEPPVSNPEAYIDYYKNDDHIDSQITKSLIISNVTESHSGKYSCTAINNSLEQRGLTSVLNLRVVKNGPPQPPTFITPPQSTYTVTKGDTVFLGCSAVGNPVPEVIWEKKKGQIAKKRADMLDGGLLIKNVTESDDGIYVCNYKNSQGSRPHQISLIYNEAPAIECLFNTTDVKQGENLDLECSVSGTPEPQISWFLNGFSVINDTEVEAIGNKIYFRPVEKRHAGNLQIFARNVVKTVYSSISVRVIPISSSIDDIPPTRVPTRPTVHSTHNIHHRGGKGGTKSFRKHMRMTPPSKPNVTRLSDTSVVVRWSVPDNKGLPIQFFKVQYRELGPANQHHDHNGQGPKGSKWNTHNADIAPHVTSYEVNDLQSDHWYRFRIAAVYSNNDNKNSLNSDKFLLRKLDFDTRNVIPVPLITHVEAVNASAVKIYWKFEPNSNTTVGGFYINYNPASSAADYSKESVDGQSTRAYVLTHLQPDTVYDIKLQSFTSKSASEFSSIMKAKTLATMTTTVPPIREVSTQLPTAESAGGLKSKLYIIIASGVIVGGGALVAAIALLLFCRKWKQKKNTRASDRDKPGVDEHHIQADGGDYVVNAKSLPRSNGCVPSNRMTITANPLADADNKNQNMIEMSCLPSQNNNCAGAEATTTTATSQESTSAANAGNSKEQGSNNNRKNKNVDKKRPKRNNANSNSSDLGENYV